MLKFKKNGFSTIEYSLFIVMIITALYVSKDFISRGMMGRWKSVGDTFAFGRQYDASRTLDCAFDGELNVWYEQSCFDQARRSCRSSDFVCERGKINQCALEACKEF